MKEWFALYESKSGERGIFSRTASQSQAKKYGRRNPDFEFGTNPCSEIILRNREFCNLTEVVVRANDSAADLNRKIKLATILGTWQSTLTNFKYLRNTWKNNCDEERLLGVSLTGIMDNEITNGKKGREKLRSTLNAIRVHAVDTNAEWANKLGIPRSAAITCVKPSGCVALDTKIKTTTGMMSIAEIMYKNNVDVYDLEAGNWIIPTEEIYVYDINNEKQKITKIYINGIKKLYEIKDDEGNTYKFTEEHKVLTKHGWKEVKNLSESDEIINY
jgi:hypothetical protein